MTERALAFVQRKYVARLNRGILYVEAAQDDLAREIVNFCKTALTPGDLATLAEGMELMTVERNLLDALVATYAPADGSIYPEPRCMRELRAILTAGRVKPSQDEGGGDG